MTDNGIGAWVNDIHQGDATQTLAEMPESSVHCVMTSPPYFGLRDYGEDVETVFGGDDDCDHDWVTRRKPPQGGENTEENPPNTGADTTTQDTRVRGGDGVESDHCTVCSAWRGQLGLEPRLDQFIENLVAVGEELHRVLRPDGSWWLNLGDSFAGSGRGQWDDDDGRPKETVRPDSGDRPDQESGLQRKSKMLVPHRVAIALQDAGWVVRSDAVWAKPNPMPHPVEDRLNEHKEYLFHLAPAPDYWFDLDSIREPHKQNSIERRQRADGTRGGPETHGLAEHTGFGDGDLHANGKNPGDILEIPVKSFPEAHFAVFPPELCETPIKSSCPPVVCDGCGMPYERETVKTPLWEQDPETVDRRKAQIALEKYRESELTVEHLEAVRSLGFGDGDHGDASQGSKDRLPESTRRLAMEAKDVLGGYFREFTSASRAVGDWRQQCECDTTETEPGIVLDPFAGAGTTCLVAKEMRRRFVGIDLNPDYVALAQRRVGIDVDEPERLHDDGQQVLASGGSDD